MRDGAWSCLTAANEWQRCNLGATPAPTDALGQLLVAQVRSRPAGCALNDTLQAPLTCAGAAGEEDSTAKGRSRRGAAYQPQG